MVPGLCVDNVINSETVALLRVVPGLCVDNVMISETVALLRVVPGLCVDNVINCCFASGGTGTVC